MKTVGIQVLAVLMIFTGALAQFPPESHWAPAEPEMLPAPGYLETVHDSIHGVDFTCLSDPEEFGVPVGAGELTHQYAKIQAWNADMSKIFIGFTYVLNADDYSIYKRISYENGYFNDARWSNVDPDTRYFCWEDDFLKINIETEQVEILHTFPGYEATIGPWEGNITADDKYVVVTNSAGDHASIYDIGTDTVLATREFTGSGFDWASFTPWGDYVVVSNNETGHTELYDLDFNYLRDLTENQEHADFAIDAQGNEVLVQVIPLSMTRLDNGEFTDLVSDAEICGWEHENPSIPGHISGRNFNLPGWAIVSTPSAVCSNGNGYYYATEIFAVKLDGSGIIRHYGHSRVSSVASIATVSPDGKKIIFQSDWEFRGTGGGNVLSYIIDYSESPLVPTLTPLSIGILLLIPIAFLMVWNRRVPGK